MEITVLRHCESVFNVDPQSSQRDCPLSLAGELQAAALQPPEERYDLALVSPLRRARQTLELSGIAYGKLEVCALAREHKTDPCDFFDGERADRAESEPEIIARAARLRRHLAAAAKRCDRVLLVAHAGLVWYLTASTGPDGDRYGAWLAPGEFCAYAP